MARAKQSDSKTDAARKAAKNIKDGVQSMADDAWRELNNRFGGMSVAAKGRSAEYAASMVKLQRSAFDQTLKVLERVQAKGGEVLQERAAKAEWMPPEGAEIIKEWNHTLNVGRAQFQKTVDKSYDLLASLFERVEKQAKQEAAQSKAAPKTAPRAKKTASAPKKPATATKKPAAKKRTPAKKA